MKGTVRWQRALAIFLPDKSGCDSVMYTLKCFLVPGQLPRLSGPLWGRCALIFLPHLWSKYGTDLQFYFSTVIFSWGKSLPAHDDLFTFGVIRIFQGGTADEAQDLTAQQHGHWKVHATGFLWPWWDLPSGPGLSPLYPFSSTPAKSGWQLLLRPCQDLLRSEI